MGVFDKLKFWEKKGDDFSDIDSIPGLDDKAGGKDDLGLGSPDRDLGMPSDSMGMADDTMRHDAGRSLSDPRQIGSEQGPSDSFGFNQQQQQRPMPSFSQQYSPSPQPSQHEYIITKEIEVISSKLDALQAGIESVNQRLASVERALYGDRNKRW